MNRYQRIYFIYKNTLLLHNINATLPYKNEQIVMQNVVSHSFPLRSLRSEPIQSRFTNLGLLNRIRCKVTNPDQSRRYIPF